MTIITRCPSCGDDMPAGDLDPVLVLLVGDAMLATAKTAGFTPERANNFARCLEKLCELIRAHDPRLRTLSDREIAVLLCNLGGYIHEAQSTTAA